MRHFSFAKSVLLLGILATACSSKDERSLVVIDVKLGNGVDAPDIVRLSASSGGQVVKSADVPWAKATNDVLEVGLFIPSGVSGDVIISAKGLRGEKPFLEGSADKPVTLKVGGSVGPVQLVLNAIAVAPDGGVDAGASDGAPDVASTDAIAPDAGRDVGLPDDPISETGSADRANSPDEKVADVGIGDGPSAPDAADTSPVQPDGPSVQPDGPSVQPDARDAIEAGHVPGWEPAQNIENDVINASYYPVVAVDPVNEHVYVAWRESMAVKVKRWNRNTGTWEKTIVVESRGGPQDVTIGADAKGNVLLLWGQSSSSDSTLVGLWASRTSDGLAWSSPVRITSVYTWNPQLAVARNGTARAVYTKLLADGTWPLYSAYYDGSAWTENPTMVAPNAVNMDQDPRLVVDASGSGILIFDSVDTGVAAAIFTGQTFSTPTILNPNHLTISPDSRAIAMNRKGEGVFVWSESSGSTIGLSARTYNPSVGWSAVTPPILASDTIGALAVAMDEQDNVTILLQQGLASGGMNVMGIHGSVNGSWSDVTALETDNVASYLVDHYAMPQLAIDASGNVLAVWRKDLSTTTTTTYAACASRFSGGSWLPQFRLGLKTGLEVLVVNVSVADSGFGAATFYFRSDNTTTDPDAYNAMVAFYR